MRRCGPGRPGATPIRPRRSWFLGAVLGCVSLAACVMAFEAPDVRIAGVRVVSLGLTEGTAAVDLEVTNPNRRTLELRGVSYRLRIEDPRDREVGWITLGEGVQAEGTTIAARDTTLVAVTVPFGYEAIEVAVRSLLREGTLDYRLDGEVRVRGPVGDLRLPLEHRGSLGSLSGDDVGPAPREGARRREMRGARARTPAGRSRTAPVWGGAHAPKSNSTSDESFPHS